MFSSFALSNLCAQDLDIIDVGSVFNQNIPLNLSEIATGIDYVALELTDDCVLGDVYNIRMNGENIVLISNKEVFLFDIQGNFKHKLGSIGKGPGEYLWARDIFMNPNGKSVFVLDITGMQIIEFSFDGTVKSTVKLAQRQYSEQLFVFENQFFVLSGRPPSGRDFIYTMDYAGNYLNGINVTIEAIESALHGGFQESAGVMIADDYFDIATAWNDTIFRFSRSGQKSALYLLNYGKYKYPLKGEKGSLSRQPPKEGYAFQHWRAITKNYLFIHSQDGRDLKLLVYNRKSNSIIHNSTGRAQGGIQNDLDGGPGISFIPSFQKNFGHDVIQCHSALDMIEVVSESKLDNKLTKLVNQLSEEDNPVIQIIHLK